MVDHIGQQLGNYQLIKLLGQGGFAEVYLGEHIYLKTPGAIKLLHTRGTNQKELDDFFKEAQAIAKLKHVNIIRLLEFGIDEKVPFLVMDYAANGTLRQRHSKETKVPIATVVAYTKQIASALQYAHNANIIHRDVKPDNILLGQGDTLWLSDFGIALTAHTSNAISTQDAVGTIAYMAPEQFQGKPRRASDQYALGLVVYEWLTGSRPFHGSFAELGMQHMHAIPAPLREKVPMLALDIEKVVLRALAKDPDERYGSIEEFAKELETAFCVGESTPLYRNMPLRIPRRTVLKHVSQPSEPIIEHVLLASNRTVPISTAIQQTPSEFVREGKLHVRQGIPGGRIGILAILVALAVLIITIPFLYPMATAAFSAHKLPTQAKLMTEYDKNALANGMMFGYDAAHTRVNPYEKTITPDNVHKLTPYWTAQMDGSPSTPTIVDGTVYVSSSKGTFYAFKADCATPCKPFWQASLDQATVSSPAVFGGVVYVASGRSGGPPINQGFLYAFSAYGCKNKNCKPLWIGKTGGPIYSSPTIANNMVYVGSSDRSLYAFKASATCDYNCNPKWFGALTGNAYDTPTVSGKFVYIGDNKGVFYAFYAAGCGELKCLPAWTAPTGGPESGSAAVANGFIYTGSTYIPRTNTQTDHNLHVFDTSCTISPCKISRIYPTKKSNVSSPAVSGTLIYIGSDDNYLYAFSTTCQMSPCGYLWRAATGGAISYSSPTVANGVVFIGSGDHYVYAFRDSPLCADPCHWLWRFNMNGRVSSSPVVANGVLYVGEQDATSQNNLRYLYAFRLTK